MKFLITVNIPKAVKDEVVPEEYVNMFYQLGEYFEKKRKAGEPIKTVLTGIRDKENEDMNINIESIKVQGEV